MNKVMFRVLWVLAIFLTGCKGVQPQGVILEKSIEEAKPVITQTPPAPAFTVSVMCVTDTAAPATVNFRHPRIRIDGSIPTPGLWVTVSSKTETYVVSANAAAKDPTVQNPFWMELNGYLHDIHAEPMVIEVLQPGEEYTIRVFRHKYEEGVPDLLDGLFYSQRIVLPQCGN